MVLADCLSRDCVNNPVEPSYTPDNTENIFALMKEIETT